MKKYLFVAILITIVTNAQNSTSLDPYQFFPANVGDRWEYTLAGGGVGWTIVRDSIDIKDSSRFIFSQYPPAFYGADYRIDKHYNVFFGPQFRNRHFYKLNANLGESWIVSAGERSVAKVLNISQAYVFGKITPVKTIGFYRLMPGDTVINENSILDYWDKLAYGFGLISREDGATQPMQLRGCRINGVTYGTVDVWEDSHTIPFEFTLYQNYPNPFNPSTTISFSIPNYSKVIVKVFDILGREIQEIVNDYFYPGKHSVEFNARHLELVPNFSGRSREITSGVYFYQLVTNKRTKTMKMILQK
ncbi:MAG: hypothetical protein FD143_2876 [Ignavibacteria bacterium]|nr:MAG: hypothetical protein FD143_2876 [Ignavibacteria bacterium]